MTEVTSSHLFGKKSRTKLACNNCRVQRRKCEGSMPCSSCVKRNVECHFQVENKRKPLNRKYVDSLLEKISSLKSMLQARSTSVKSFSIDSNLSTFLKSSKVDIRNICTRHDVFKLDIDANDLVTFHGPTTMRHMSTPPLINFPLPTAPILMDSTTHELLAYFFDNINGSFPLVDKTLFYESVTNPSTKYSSNFASNSLVNAIAALGASRMGSDHLPYKQLAATQIMQEIDSVHITQVQTLLILTLIEMTDNNEVKSSCYMSMACSIANHLGLQLASDGLDIPANIKKLRSNVFWCCFMLDRIRYPILGVGTYLDSIDISNNLNVASANDSMLIIREFCILLDISTISIQMIYSLRYQIELIGENGTRRLSTLKDASSLLSKWELELPPTCRLRYEDRDIDDHPNKQLLYMLHIYYNVTKILIHKPFMGNPNDRNIDIRDRYVPSIIQIMELLDKLDYDNCPFLPFAIYALYIATVCSLFETFYQHRRKMMFDWIQKGKLTMRRLKKKYSVARVYYERLVVVRNDWKMPFDFETGCAIDDSKDILLPNFEDIDFTDFLWPSFSADPTFQMFPCNSLSL